MIRQTSAVGPVPPVDPRPVEERPDRPPGDDRPIRTASVSKGYVRELGGCAAAAVATVWLIFALVGVSAPFGLIVCSLLVFFVYFGVVSWRLHGVLQMKDRLGTLAV